MTEGENMLERCARAAQESPAWPAVYGAGTARVIARAVIEALMEPTPEMLASGANEIRRFDRDREFADAGASAVFQAMLRTASKPNDEGEGK